MAKNPNVPEGDIISVPVDAPAVEEFVDNAMKTVSSKVFTEDEVERIRQQEKDKMYKRLEDADVRVKSMEEQMALIAAEREEARLEAEKRAAKEQELIREREVNELSAKELLLKREDEFNSKLNQIEQDYKTRFEAIEAQRQQQEALLEKERALQELNSYRQRRMHEEQENIIPELIDFVTGNSADEVENSIAVLRERSNAIIESIQQATAQQQGRLRGVSPTAPPIGPMDTQMEYQQLTAEDIRNMPMEQYAKMRERLMNARPTRGRY
jgi:DNA repair exonuclease SbcCD ATPase subunit